MKHADLGQISAEIETVGIGPICTGIENIEKVLFALELKR